ncbi:LPS assembly lipoprotein LptE [Xanthobacteraceae bacterium A53D]
MSSPDAPLPARRTLLRFAAIGGLALALAGCFQPMYGERTVTASGSSLQHQLRDIEVVKIQGRLGDVLRNDMIFELNGGAGNPVGAPYKLLVDISSNSLSSIVDTTSGLPQNRFIRVAATWRLLRAGEETKPPVIAGKAAGSASIDLSDQRFANYRATRDAEDRAAKMAAEQIRTQLIAFFMNPPPPAPAAVAVPVKPGT